MDKNKKHKNLYKKYSSLNHPVLIREAIQLELKANEIKTLKATISSYYKNKRCLLKQLNIIKSRIENNNDVNALLYNKDYLTVSNFMNTSSLIREYNEIKEGIERLDLKYSWAVFKLKEITIK